MLSPLACNTICAAGDGVGDADQAIRSGEGLELTQLLLFHDTLLRLSMRMMDEL